MNFFETLLVLLAIAVALLRVSRRFAIPYPTMLAAAGVAIAMAPGAPEIHLEPHVALALFIAPALVDAAFDFPLQQLRRLWLPLFSLAVVVVLLSAFAVAGLGVLLAGLPFAAALALGAIVAPPDAAAAVAVLGSVKLPARSVAVLKGESLLNDASALLLFSAAMSVQSHAAEGADLAFRLAIAAPGGIALGVGLAVLSRAVMPLFAGTLGGNVLEFITCFGVWILAERLGLSAVLCLVAFAMTIATRAPLATRPRLRIQSFAVWSVAVFVLNVLAFMLMGLQARSIVSGMSPERLREAALFALAVIVCLVVVRMGWTMVYGAIARRSQRRNPHFMAPTRQQSVLVGWCGMRGLVTLATAFSLPADFPQRDLVVLTAFAVVLATLIVQGLTLGFIARALGFSDDDSEERRVAAARAGMAQAAITALEHESGPSAGRWRQSLEDARAAWLTGEDSPALTEKRRIGLLAVRAQREALERLRARGEVSDESYLSLQEGLDFSEVALSEEVDQRIIEA